MPDDDIECDYPGCDFCDSIDVNLNKRNYFREGRMVEEHYTICDLCSSTYATDVVNYDYSDVSSKELLKTILYVGNEILKEMKSKIY